MNSSPVAACILAKHYNESTKRAINSALKFDLPVYLGLTHDAVGSCEHKNINVFPVQWQNDFAAARNAFLDKVSETFLLWVDSDEEIFSFPKINWDHIKENVFYFRLQFNSEFTPRICSQMHRNHPGIFWKRKIHEYITATTDDLYRPRFLNSVILRHHGYENQEVVLQKHERNLQVAESTDESEKSYVENLVRLRRDIANGRPNFFEWLECYRQAKLVTNLHRGHSYYEFEPALMLCMAGYSPPAEACVQVNPINMLMQIALLTHEYKYRGEINETRLDFIFECLTCSLYDVYEDFPRVLLGADKNKIIDYIQLWANEWEDSIMSDTGFTDHWENVNNNTVFIRSKAVSEEKFDADLLLMNQLSKKVVVLNSSSAILWKLLSYPMPYAKLTGILQQAFPNQSVELITNSINALVSTLLKAELIHTVDSSHEENLKDFMQSTY